MIVKFRNRLVFEQLQHFSQSLTLFECEVIPQIKHDDLVWLMLDADYFEPFFREFETKLFYYKAHK